MPSGIDRAILELEILYNKLQGLEVFAQFVGSPEWLGYKGGVEDCRMHLLLTIKNLKGEKDGI